MSKLLLYFVGFIPSLKNSQTDLTSHGIKMLQKYLGKSCKFLFNFPLYLRCDDSHIKIVLDIVLSNRFSSKWYLTRTEEIIWC